jgi:hypothetical protein
MQVNEVSSAELDSKRDKARRSSIVRAVRIPAVAVDSAERMRRVLVLRELKTYETLASPTNLARRPNRMLTRMMPRYRNMVRSQRPMS